jgi:GNAT superfamily N-acetyltransferase
LSFSASKATDPTIYYEPDQPQPNPESRAKLYDRLVQRYARAWGYRAFRADTGDLVIYELSRLKQGVAEGLDDNGISFQVQKGKNKFATTLSVGGDPVGVYQYDANTGRSIAEIYPEFKGKGLGKLLVLHAIYTAANLGLDFQEDESRTSDYDNVLDSLSSNGYIVDDDGYWYVTGDGEQYLKQSLKQDVAEARGLAPTKPYDDLMANMGYFMSLNTVKIQQDAVDSNAQQELANMQQQFRQPILNGMSFFDVNRDTKISKNPKVAPILLKYVYDMLGYIEPRIKKYVKPDQQGKYLDRLNQIKNDYRGAVQQVS